MPAQWPDLPASSFGQDHPAAPASAISSACRHFHQETCPFVPCLAGCYRGPLLQVALCSLWILPPPSWRDHREKYSLSTEGSDPLRILPPSPDPSPPKQVHHGVKSRTPGHIPSFSLGKQTEVRAQQQPEELMASAVEVAVVAQDRDVEEEEENERGGR